MSKNSVVDEIGKMTEMLTADSKEDFDEEDTNQDPEPKDDNPEVDPDPGYTPDSDPEPDPKPEEDSKDEPVDDEDEAEGDVDKDPAPDELALAKARIIELESAAKKEPEVKPEPEPAPEPEVTPEENFLGELDIDDIIRDPGEFNKLLNTVYKKGLEAARIEARSSQEGILKSIPDIVKSNITLVSSLKKASEDFYNENKDLAPFKKTVAAVFEELASENPDKKYTELFKDLGTDVRKRLGLAKIAKDVVKDKPKNESNLPTNKGKKRPTGLKPKTSSIEAELDSMNRALEED